MKAAVLEKFGSIDDLVIKDVSVPEIGKGQLLIKTAFAAVNPYDWKIAEGAEVDERLHLPVIPGSELSGTIEATGEGVTEFKKGAAVCGNLKKFGGCYAEYAVADAEDFAIKPAEISFEDAAAIPLASLTARKALFDEGKLEKGQRVFIHGASGNVGSMAVQEAKLAGAYVIAAGSGKNEQRVKSLGADEFIDYKTEDFSALTKDIDLVLDTVGGKTLQDSFKVLKPGGRLISLVEQPSEALAEKYSVHAKVIYGGPNAKRLQTILQEVVEGKIKVAVEKIYPLQEAVAALADVKKGHRNGKILLKV